MLKIEVAKLYSTNSAGKTDETSGASHFGSDTAIGATGSTESLMLFQISTGRGRAGRPLAVTHE